MGHIMKALYNEQSPPQNVFMGAGKNFEVVLIEGARVAT